MDGQTCPKCGSNQVLNDQCLKCGIVVSKFLQTSQPVSFIAPSRQSYKEYSYSISKETLEYEERRKKHKQQTVLLGAGIVAIAALIGYGLWHLLTHQASTYSGAYKNGHLIYGMFFPESDSKWYHARANNLESLGIKDPADAFYRGDPDEPEISFAIYVRPIQAVPERFSEEQKEKMLAEEEESLIRRMKLQRVSCEIVDSTFRSVGGRDGFLIEAEIDKGGKLYRAFVLHGYYYSSGYTVFFVGLDEFMQKDPEELQRLMDSFTFKTAII